MTQAAAEQGKFLDFVQAVNFMWPANATFVRSIAMGGIFGKYAATPIQSLCRIFF